MMLISLFFAVRHTKGRTSAQSRQVGLSHVWNDIKVIRGEVLLLSGRQEGTKIPLMEEILHHLGCTKNPIDSGINQLVQVFSINTISASVYVRIMVILVVVIWFRRR